MAKSWSVGVDSCRHRYLHLKKSGETLINDKPIQKHYKIPFRQGNNGIQRLQNMTAKLYARKPKQSVF